MKVALCGGGPLAIEMALALHNLGGAITIFSQNPLGGSVRQMAQLAPHLSLQLPWHKITSDLGRNYNNEHANNSKNVIPTVQEYWEKYLHPLVQLDFVQKQVRSCRLKRVHKRFLSPLENVAGKSRLVDLFRAVYAWQPQLAPATTSMAPDHLPSPYQGVAPQILSSLQEELEAFEDFDLVVDATGVLHHPLPMGPAFAPAVGEDSPVAKKQIFYSQQIFAALTSPRTLFFPIAIIGSGLTAAHALLQLGEQFLNAPQLQVALITTELQPFTQLAQTEAGKSIAQKVQQLLQKWRQQDDQATQEYLLAKEEWMALDSFVQVKIRPPQMPRPKVRMYAGFNVVAIDKLIDQDPVYLSVEAPHFRSMNFEHSELGSAYEYTLAVQQVFVCTGYQRDASPFQSLLLQWDIGRKNSLHPAGLHPETGFYTLGTGGNDRYDLACGLQQIPEILQDIQKYFKKVGS